MKGVEIIKIKTMPYTITIYIWLYGLFNVFKDISLMIWPLFRSLGRNLSNFSVIFGIFEKYKKTFWNYLTFSSLLCTLNYLKFQSWKSSITKYLCTYPHHRNTLQYLPNHHKFYCQFLLWNSTDLWLHSFVGRSSPRKT